MRYMVWPFKQQPVAQSPMSFGATSSTQSNGFGTHPQFQNQWGAQAQQPNPFMAGVMGGAGVNSQYAQQPVTPPSELEIVAMLLNQQTPVDSFLAGPNLNLLVSIIANLVNLSLVEFFRNAKFTENKDGELIVDITSLPTEYQTLSPENVMTDLTALQASCNQAVQKSLTDQQQTLQMAQQSIMQGALDAALTDPNMMEKVGGAFGGLARGVVGIR